MCLQPKQWVHSAGFCASLKLFLNDNAVRVFECVLRVHVRGAVARSLKASVEQKFSAHTAERTNGLAAHQRRTDPRAPNRVC